MTATPDNAAGRQTESIMAALRRAGVLKEDEPGYPVHYNRAYSAVYEALADLPPIFEPTDVPYRRGPYMGGR